MHVHATLSRNHIPPSAYDRQIELRLRLRTDADFLAKDVWVAVMARQGGVERRRISLPPASSWEATFDLEIAGAALGRQDLGWVEVRWGRARAERALVDLCVQIVPQARADEEANQEDSEDEGDDETSG